MSAKFLIDANLPYHFSLWNTEDFVHQHDLASSWKDDAIWQFAKEHNLIIVTKDSDFSDRVLFHEPPPKVILIRFGNLKMKDFFAALSRLWDEAVDLLRENRLVVIYRDRVESIS